MPTKFENIDESMLVENSLNRATSYLTTNAMIHVTLCGLFATTIAVLVALAEQKDGISSDAVYRYVIPAFSCVILTVSLNVSNWISEQLNYLEMFGRPRSGKDFIYFEEFLELINTKWSERSFASRFFQVPFKALLFYATMPLRLNNIYCYYFLIYTLTPVVGIFRHMGMDALWLELPILIGIQLFLIGTGLKRYLMLEIIQHDLREHVFEVNDLAPNQETLPTPEKTEQKDVDQP